MTISLEQVGQDLARVSALTIEAVEALKTQDIFSILKAFKALKDGYKIIDDHRKEIYHQVEFLSKSYIPETMLEKGGGSSLTLKDIGYRFTVSTSLSATILDKDKAYEWLREQGQDGIITETVNASTLSKFAKTYTKDFGLDLPECFKVNPYYSTSVTKVN